MKKNQVQFGTIAPYFTIGDVTESTKAIWLIFHGYGQLVEHFHTHFSVIDPVDNRLVFPQGLSKFYLKGVDKQIGASWMTAYEREVDIQNYISYLDQVYQLEVKPYNLQINIIGFSQGVHTASRWIHHSKIPYQKFIAWGAGLAQEIDKEIVEQSFGGENYVVIGDQDRFVSAESLETMKLRYKAIGFNYKLISYQGTHDIYPEVLKPIL
jgi:predicted esterase